MRAACAALLLSMSAAGLTAGDATSLYAGLPGGRFESTLDYEDVDGSVRVRPFALMRKPVTNAEFLAFVRKHPEWQRDNAPPVLAEQRYLSHCHSGCLRTNARNSALVTGLRISANGRTRTLPSTSS